MDGTYLLSGLRLLEGAIVLVLNGTTLFPGKDCLSFDVVSLQLLDVVGLANRLDQRIHLVWEFGDENHGLEMRGDGAFRCCHSGEPNEDGIDCKGRVGVSGDDDIHCRLEFFVGGGDSGFAISGLKEIPSLGGEHGVYVGVLLHGLLEEVQDGCGDGGMETEHDVPQGFVVNVEPVIDISLVFRRFADVFCCLGFGSTSIALPNCLSDDFVFRGREFVCNSLPLALRE